MTSNNTTTKIFDYNTKKFYCVHKKYKELCGKCAVELLEFRETFFNNGPYLVMELK